MELAPGIYRGLSFADYTAINAASNTRLKHLRRSPAHLKAHIDGPQPDKRSLIVGRAIHTAVLEPDLFPTMFAVADRCTAVTKKLEQCSNDGIRFHPELGWLCGVHLKNVPGSFDDARFVLSPEDRGACTGASDAIRRHPKGAQILGGEGDNELTLVWFDAETGLRCKARLDRYAPEWSTIGDVKSTRDASSVGFERESYSHQYQIQAAHYLDGAAACGLTVEHFVFLAVEKEPPYAVGAYRLTDGAIAAGRDQVRALLRRYAACVETGDYPAYSDDIIDLALPDYAWSQIERELTEIAA